MEQNVNIKGPFGCGKWRHEKWKVECVQTIKSVMVGSIFFCNSVVFNCSLSQNCFQIDLFDFFLQIKKFS